MLISQGVWNVLERAPSQASYNYYYYFHKLSPEHSFIAFLLFWLGAPWRTSPVLTSLLTSRTKGCERGGEAPHLHRPQLRLLSVSGRNICRAIWQCGSGA